jgi:hypothetical protein
MADTEITPALHAEIDTVVRRELGRFGVESVETIDSKDQDGDPIIQVLVHYRDSKAEPDPKVASETVTKLNDRLYELRERRFAYIRHEVPEAVRRSRARS